MKKYLSSPVRWIASAATTVAVGVLAVVLLPLASSATTTIGTNISTDGTFTVNGNTTIGDAATDTITVTSAIQGASPLVFEGTTDDTNHTTFAITDPTAARTITFPDATGTLALATLENLASVAINTSLISDTAATDDLGSAALY